ncbi:Mediator complex subunit Med13 [Penicillium malachiteum]|uniref:Mediator of RNA polymerase II transcription subunit 13 n=1 Tax=Penicillium malachiteum TaxID=1324776 RepID=A0AAD6HLW7_9EURO|nr:Mediator complex subunit Med13 [Penicillium malachiteum]
MDFPGGASTNVHLIDGFSTIYWRIYTEEPGIANQPEGPANGYTILKHLGRLKDLEVSALGSITSHDLVRSLSSEVQTGQQRPQQGQPAARRPDGYSSSAAIYASFISAVTGAISLQLIRSHGALPLGSRTLFTAVEAVGYESPRVDNESSFARAYLTTLYVQLNATGTITISTQTIAQDGIQRLYSPQYDIADLAQLQQGTDIWLSPNGTVARLVTANVESPTAVSPDAPAPVNWAPRKAQWKSDVARWLLNFGLHVDTNEEEPWVEIEVWEPFFARLSGETRRQNDDAQSPLPLKRMLWPARFCFRRVSSQVQSPSIRNSWPLGSTDDPLDFAERWPSQVESILANHQKQPVPIIEEPPSKDENMTSPKADSLDGFESLARMAQYPDLPAANLVYPTPPDGAAVVGINNSTAQNDLFPDDTYSNNLSPAVAQHPKNIANAELSPDMGVGTGHYDASDDEDLFGEMKDRDFGSKGITDADFSFFDDPEFEDMDADPPNAEPDEPEQPALKEENRPEEIAVDGTATTTADYSEAPDVAGTLVKEVNVTEDRNEPEPVDEPMKSPSPALSPPSEGPTIISPPLSPVEVKKILFSGAQKQDPGRPDNNRSQPGHYQPVAFEKKIGDWDQKYGSAGKFWFSSGNAPDASGQPSSAIPTIGLPHRARNGSNTTQAKLAGKGATPNTLANSNQTQSDSSDSETSYDSDDMSSESPPSPPTLLSLKRKRVPSESDIQSAMSPAKSAGAPDPSGNFKVENCAFLGNFLANFSDWTFTGYFSAFPAQQLPVIVRKEDQISIAQLLIDQVTQSSLNHSLGGCIDLFSLESENLSWRTHLEDSSSLGEASKLDLKSYISLRDDLPVAPSQPASKETPKGLIARIPAPHVRMRRGKEYLEALPPAVSFWETFGLEPAHGAKDISAYCIHPYAATKSADAFLSLFGLHYQSCNLGSHSRGDKSMAFENGLKSWDSETSSYASMMQSLKSICEELGTDLSQYSPSADNCVVYIINPFPHAAALADICAAFWHLFQQIAADTDRQQGQPINEVVLQIIPLSFIMSQDSMVVPTQSEYMNLSFEVYSRCRPKESSISPLLCAPAVLLADPLPKAINFRLAPDKASPLQDGRSLHIACSKSSDQRWVSVAWTDGTGSIQTNMSYCLRYRNRGTTRAFAEIRNEIWAITRHIMDKFQARWKMILVNCEPIDPEEVEAWSTLVDQQNKLRPGFIELTVMAVSTIPELVLEAASSQMTTNVLNFSSTPISTPNPSVSVASPEQSGNALTPSAAYNAPTPTDPSLEPDSDVILTDIMDESWAVVLSHRLNSSPHVTEFRPALASGYLLRRKGTSDNDGVFTMTANLIHSQRPAAAHEAVLKDILGMYRDLSSLARARGMRSVQENTLPWHIATALRAQELLSYVF